MTRILCLTMVLLATAAAAEPLTLADAQALAAARNPVLAEAAAVHDAAAAAADQAGAWPNPRLFLELENAPRDGDLWRDAERITGLEWSPPWRGVRGAESAAARARAEAAAADHDAAALNLRAAVHAAFADVLHARERGRLSAETAAAWERTEALARRRAETGDAAPVEAVRARLAAAAARADAEAARADAAAAVAALAALLDVPQDRAAEAAGELGRLMPDPAPADSTAPALRAADARRRAQADAARAASRRRLPELDVGLGLRRPGGGGERALDLAVGLELPLFDRRGADARRAHAEVRAADARRAAVALDRTRELRAAAAELDRARARHAAVTADLLPAAAELERTAAAAHASGDIGLADLIPMRAEALALRVEALDAARDLEHARARLLRLGAP